MTTAAQQLASVSPLPAGDTAQDHLNALAASVAVHSGHLEVEVSQPEAITIEVELSP